MHYVDKVTLVPLPLSESLMVNKLRFTTLEWGGALSSFGNDPGSAIQGENKVFEVDMIGISMLDAMALFNLPQPDYIKMDVDGIEHLILKGGLKVLSQARGILVEVDEEFLEQRVKVEKYLNEAGLVLKGKYRADMFDAGIYEKSYNQIWHREP